MGIVEAPTSSYSSPAQHSPWHSPVPYLFGGFAAMLGLIGFALLILACSYWKLSGYLENQGETERDLEAGEVNGSVKAVPPVFEEKYLVILAGQEKPTCLATPMSSRASSFSSKSTSSKSTETSVEDNEEKKKEKNDGNVEMGNIEDHEAADQVH
ncbi:protein GLUTAMINE DUMPER 3-like [Olea europaea var. sylvestris]|uniref:protein GLUTAMINE DUMPER 3-like n=1 Tax=Olea europaea var. sylvestris TaxID=158386 RepID=UPI000C1CE448|nr:protein GLUTAMINE DUMPER 3-like [Olea europaea var. sylvestris]